MSQFLSTHGFRLDAFIQVQTIYMDGQCHSFYTWIPFRCIYLDANNLYGWAMSQFLHMDSV